MPELPEIEVVKKSLFKMVNKSKITSIKINNKNLCHLYLVWKRSWGAG